MNFLANENIPNPSISILRNSGFNIISISEDYPGISDEEVIKIAVELGLIILTFDKDYGKLIYQHKVSDIPAIVFFRYKGNDPEFAGSVLLDLIENRNLKFEGYFSIIEKDNIRQRKLN